MTPGYNAWLAIVSHGQPRDPRTWSGTPVNLCRTLEAVGAQLVPFDRALPASRSMEMTVKLLSKIFYAGSRYARLGRVERSWHARRRSRWRSGTLM